jgi:dihydroxyacid dehydratase/phosphogluconate dehydratase
LTAHNSTPPRRFRSRDWFDNPDHIDMTALYLERFMNYGITPEELRSGKPIIGIAQTGSDISPCNRIHLDLVTRIRDGIRDAGGIPMEFPVHPIFENCRRPTAALDRNLSYLGLVETLHGYPIDAVVLTTGCDKTTPAGIMAATTVNIPAIVLSGGPMLDGWHDGELVGSGTVIWRSRRKLAAGEINEEEFIQRAADSAPSAGHCNTMGTASTMNAVAEALGLSLTGCAAIPAPYRERGQMAYRTGQRIVDLAYEDIKALDILTKRGLRERHRPGRGGRRLDQRPAAHRGHGAPRRPGDHRRRLARGLRHPADRQHAAGRQVSGRALPPGRRRAGRAVGAAAEGPPARRRLTVTGKTMGENLEGRETKDREVIFPYAEPLAEKAGFLVLKGNLFDFAIMKTSVIGADFRERYLSSPARKTSSRPGPSCSTARTTITPASTTRR